MTLNRAQAQAFYDRFGKKQDSQAIYEDAALDELIAHGAFGQAQAVFELGFGTGRLALRLLSRHLPPTASYAGIDLSATMTALAAARLAPFAGRATVTQTDGAIRFPLPDRSVDRVVSTYVLDLLSEEDIRAAIAEAQRVLATGGKLCLVSLTYEEAPVSRVVTALWSMLFRFTPSLVGGCRPVRLLSFFDRSIWSIEHRSLVTRFGVTSEVLVAGVNRSPHHRD